MTDLTRRTILVGAAAVSSAAPGMAVAQVAPAMLAPDPGQQTERVRRIAVEEHYWTPELRDSRSGHDVPYGAEQRQRLDDLGELRITEMDEAGIDLQVVSHQEPGVQNFEGQQAIRLAKEANDHLHRAVEAHPTRFAGFAALPTAEPEAAARELERAVKELGFKGTMINGLTRGRFIDEHRFWPILEAAESLGVPISLHPATPHSDTIDIYYSAFSPSPDIDPRTNIIARAGHGFTSEVQLSAVRLVLSDVFDRFPRLQVIVGHLGEGLPFIMPRVDRSIRNATSGIQGDDFRIKPKSLTERLKSNFYFAASGHFTHAALQMTIEAIGLERVLFAMDYPFGWNGGSAFIEEAPLDEVSKKAILQVNAERLLKL